MNINIHAIANTSVLSGSELGKLVFAKLVSQVSETETPSVLFLDFLEIEFASGSFLREAIFEFKKFVRSSRPTVYPVIANANHDIQEDLLLIADARNDVLMTCELEVDGSPSSPKLLGSLDPKQSLTLNLVESLGSANANVLMNDHGKGENIKSATTWNNRLSGLAAKGIIREFASGRSKTYTPLFDGVKDGN